MAGEFEARKWRDLGEAGSGSSGSHEKRTDVPEDNCSNGFQLYVRCIDKM